MQELTPHEVFELVCGLAGSIASLLLFGNLFFIRRLIRKVDLIDPLVGNISNLARRLDELCGRVETINELRIEVATLKARFLNAKKSRYGGNGVELHEEDEA